MRPLSALALSLTVLFSFQSSDTSAMNARRGDDFASLRARAEELGAQGSFELAHRVWVEAAELALAPDERRWVDFRLADTSWRAASASQRADPTPIEEARRALEEMQRKVDRPESKDRVWAEVEESLADWHWARRDAQDFYGALPHYQAALDWWAGARDIDAARGRYLAMVWRMALPAHASQNGFAYASQVPVEVLENALRIAVGEDDRAEAQVLLAMNVRNRGADYEQIRRAMELLASAISAPRKTAWYDDALFCAAQWLESNGMPELSEDGSWSVKPDCTRALALYRRIVREFKKGDTPYFDQARSAIERILRTEIGVYVAHTFLPGSEIGYTLSWRNVDHVDVALYAVDLTQAVDLQSARHAASQRSSSDWLAAVDLAGVEKRASFAYPTKDDGQHRPGSAELHLDEKLAPGAYVLEVRAGESSAREIVMVTSSALVLKASSEKAIAWFHDALTSEPIAHARLALWERTYERGAWRWRARSLETDDDGIAVADFARHESSEEIFVAALKGDRTAFAVGGAAETPRGDATWKVFAFTDRSTYRPLDTVQWKVIARTAQGGKYATPANGKLDYEITDPRGASVSKGALELNAFGAAWSSLATRADLPLGEYHVSLYTARGKHREHVGTATLFRLEEYKLPEFEVKVAPAARDGKRVLYKSGDKVEAAIDAQYYFGAPVANADVEIVVYQKPYWHRWFPQREFDWFYEADDGSAYGSGPGQIATREVKKTDAAGRATISFPTARNAGQEFEYTIEARVTDASRREVAGRGAVRVTNHAYAVNGRALHNLVRPGDKLEVAFEARDANDEPVEVHGDVHVVRNRWVEVWIDPTGREVSGEALERARADAARSANGRGLAELGWKIKLRGYETEEIATTALDTDARGQALLAIAAARDGYYTATWKSREPFGGVVEASAVVWVASPNARDLDYRSHGLEIVLDKDTFKAGETAPVMIATPVSNRWVLFSVESSVLHSYRVVHVEGTAKLVMLPIGEEHVPNVFLSAFSAANGEALVDVKEVVVPPVDRFLDVRVSSDGAQYLPGGEGEFSVDVRDAHGEPAIAEVALALTDAAVAAIDKDRATDPRPFFYGSKRGLGVQTRDSFEAKRFAKLALDEHGNLRDERQAREELERKELDDGVAIGGRSDLPSRGRAKDERLSGVMKRHAMSEGVAPAAAKSAAQNAAREMDVEAEPAVEVRSDFRETALWKPDLVTDAHGRATIHVRYPESLTRWHLSARVAAADARFGAGELTTRTEKPLIARLEAPRFFVVGDEVTLSGLFDNRTDEPMAVHPVLDARGLQALSPSPQSVAIAPHSQARVDWKVRAVDAGAASITLTGRSMGTLTGRSAGASDGMVKSFPVHAHGIEAFLSRALVLHGQDLMCTLDIPAQRRPETTELVLQVSPSLAVTMLDALPYLVDYPYGCTEQTLSRFLPAAVVARTLADRGLSAEDAMSRAFGGIEAKTAAATHPKGKHALDELAEMERRGLERLYEFQHADGGWGWWKEGASDPYMSAYAVWGLSLARDAHVDVQASVLERGSRFLALALVDAERNPDLAAWMLHALAASSRTNASDEHVRRAFDNLWKDKDALNAYTRALFALAAHGFGRDQEAAILAQNLANGAQIDAASDASSIDPAAGRPHGATAKTAHWGADRVWNRWSEGGIEATAFALRALVAIDPKNELVEPAMTWLVQNRRGAQWSNTRDTAICVLALDDYLQATGETAREIEYELTVNGAVAARVKLAPADMLSAPSRISVPLERIVDGPNEIRLKRVAGEGPLYLSARAKFFSREEPVPPRGNEMFVKRQYYKLVGRPTLLKGYVYDKVPLEDGGSVASGERVEVVLTLESKNDFEYLLVQDLKPAGLEAVQQKSGEAMSVRELRSSEVSRAAVASLVADPGDVARYTGRRVGVHEELRDREVALFVDKLPQGVWEARYELRAEAPGRFHALPTLGEAMYVPEIRCNGRELRLSVDERGVQGD